MSLPFEIERHLGEIEAEIGRLGAELVEVTFRRSGGRGVLTILADKRGGITLEDCAVINRHLGDLLDALGEKDAVIQTPYILEVNSPGLDRLLKTAKDFSRAIGDQLRVVHRDETGKISTLIGEVVAADESGLELQVGDKRIRVALDPIIKAVRDIRMNG